MLNCNWSICRLNPIPPPPLSPFPLPITKTLKSFPNRPPYRFMASTTQQHQSTSDFLMLRPYHHPPWASNLNPIPSHAFSLGHFPTPIHKWNLPNLPKDTEVWLKRDDLSGMQLSGNKVRKLEFLLADAVAQGADCIITIGGIQSNHCRATAVAAKYLNLDCFLILRTSKALVDKDPGLTGNLLVERLVGAHIDLTLTNLLKEKLIKEGRKPYVIPVGGSNSLGTCGGTVAGLSMASWLSELKTKAAYGMMKDMAQNPTKWESRKILFIHTGGLLGLFDKAEEIASSVGGWRRMDLDESIPRKDGTGKMF
ncbi:1-aminocyclopropane-1-carboxylate deaminase/D-cysteine desulfhydrase [Cynara cardunculus var. scolymus]|uniref:1-aminocyclopropane-1-carboxylate deaminase/D-cysteine desulfhydrase n=1 Tax=Cynara cardunculus var. scolymus TaxID=59895 RepID=A0A103YE80_CYNCS|nr:1-aminocyclopropane-1-carboxylate deaminase/D-cysteine desulfhydrase [Cynara cardunculus var. scolymus]